MQFSINVVLEGAKHEGIYDLGLGARFYACRARRRGKRGDSNRDDSNVRKAQPHFFASDSAPRDRVTAGLTMRRTSLCALKRG